MPSLRSTILSLSPTGLLWPSSTTMIDLVGALTVTPAGTPTSVAGPSLGAPSALSLDVGDTLTIADHANIDLGATFSIAFALRKTVTTGNRILVKANDAAASGYQVYLTSNLMRLQTGDASNYLRQTTVDTATTWKFYTFIRDGASSIFELDGTDDTNVSSSTAMTDSNQDLIIGPDNVTYEIAFLAWWKSAITAANNQTIYDARDEPDPSTNASAELASAAAAAEF